MRRRRAAVSMLALLLVGALPALAAPNRGIGASRADRVLPEGFLPAIARADQVGRWFVLLDSPSVLGRGLRSADAQRAAAQAILRSQSAAVAEAESLGGLVVFRTRGS